MDMNNSDFSPVSPEQSVAIIDVWKEILSLSDVDLDRGFADLGGTSLAANRFVARLSQELRITLPVIRIFEYPTLRLLLRYLTEGVNADVGAVEACESDEAITGAAPVSMNLEEKVAVELAAMFNDFSGMSVGSTQATFIECGFDSLVLIQISVEIGKRYRVSVSLRELMDSRNTVVRLASHILDKASPDRLIAVSTAPPQEISKPQAIAISPLAEVLTFVRVSTEQPAEIAPSDATAYLREKLTAMRDFIDLQLSRIDVPAADPPDIVEIQIPSARRLIRRKLEQPPIPGAFRSSSANGEDTWFIYDSSQLCYSRVRH